MKKFLLKSVIVFSLSLGITVFLYWPLYQKILLSNPRSNIDKEVNKIVLPLSDEVKEILDRKIDLPLNRHELCLKNQNGFHFIHSDSNISGAPFIFYTDDLNRQDYGKKVKLGAMAINLYYKNNLLKDEDYREFGQPKKCIILDAEKLKNYASSTIEYSYAGLNKLFEIDLGALGKLSCESPIVGGYFIDTTESSAYIIARWNFFLLTLGALILFFCAIINWLLKLFQKIYLGILKYFKKKFKKPKII